MCYNQLGQLRPAQAKAPIANEHRLKTAREHLCDALKAMPDNVRYEIGHITKAIDAIDTFLYNTQYEVVDK